MSEQAEYNNKLVQDAGFSKENPHMTQSVQTPKNEDRTQRLIQESGFAGANPTMTPPVDQKTSLASDIKHGVEQAKQALPRLSPLPEHVTTLQDLVDQHYSQQEEYGKPRPTPERGQYKSGGPDPKFAREKEERDDFAPQHKTDTAKETAKAQTPEQSTDQDRTRTDATIVPRTEMEDRGHIQDRSPDLDRGEDRD